MSAALVPVLRRLDERLDGRIPVLMDLSLAAALGAGLLVADLRMSSVRHGSVPTAVQATGIIIAASAVAFRGPWPRGATLGAVLGAGLTTFAGGPPPVTACVAVTAFTMASTGKYSLWWPAPVAASAVVSAGIGFARISSWLAAIIAGVAIIGLGWFAGQAARERRNRMIATAERQAELQRQHAAEVRQAAIDERLVIARELHDIVAHSMSVIAVRAGVARMVMDDEPAQVKEALTIIERTTRNALHEMRLLVEVLRREKVIDAALSPTPGLADVPSLAEQIMRSGVRLDLSTLGTPRILPAGVDLSAYRIAQEALTNVVRHAGPTRASLRIEYRPTDLLIEVTDAGPPTDTSPRRITPRTDAGHGLIGMGERVALYGGDLRTGPHGRGFQVRAVLRTDDEPE